MDSPHLAPSFVRALINSVVGLVIIMGAALLGAMCWQGIATTDEAARQEINETVERATERLRILVRAAEMTAESAEKAVRILELTSETLRPVLERSLAAFEQRPELSYLCIALADTGEYGCLERTADTRILLWLFPGSRLSDPFTRIFELTDKGFVLREQRPADGYDPRPRPFYQAALQSASGDAWVPAYQWIDHSGNRDPLWGISYVKALRNSDGRLLGVLDTDLDLPALNKFLSGLAKEYRSSFQIAELAATPRLIGGQQVTRTPQAMPAETDRILKAAGDAFAGRIAAEGQLRWFASRRLALKGDVSWLVVASRNAPFIEAPLRRQLYEVIGVGALIAAGLVLVSVRMARRFGKPLAELERRVAAIGRPESGISTTRAVDGTAEFRETQLLGAALDRMHASVSQLLEAKEQQAASLALKGAIFDATNTAIFSFDDSLSILEWNASAERLFGLEREQTVGRAISDVLFAADGAVAWPAVLATSGSGTLPFRGVDGAFDAEFRLLAFKQNGRDIRTLFLNDVSERKRSEAALSDSLARFHAAARATGDVIWDWNLATNAIWWNENFQILFGYRAEEIEPTIASWATRVHPDDHDRVLEHIHAVLLGGDEMWTDEYRFRRKDGSYADVFDRGQVLRDDSGRGVRMIGAIQDITERKQAERRIRFLATHDGLTGLPNRNLIQDRIAQAISHARRNASAIALLYLDMDRFKVVNDGYGHPFGDEVLKAASERLRALVRDGDTVSRQGGDEFLILLTDLRGAADAHRVAQKIVSSLDEPLLVLDRKIHLTGSIGVSLFPDDGDNAEALICNADLAMYRAKDMGRNTCQFFTSEMSEETQRRVELETRLRGAVAGGQLHVAYQAKASLETGGITGCEALLRWRHPDLGSVSPGQFIPIAEDSGLIVPLGDWVLRTACAQAKAWLDAGLPPVCVAVNISARQFLQQDVVGWVMSALSETGLPAAQLELELTESLIAQDVGKVIACFGQLRAAGVKLSIDDFGTGYSSLNYLKRFRVDTLKIDQSFVRDMLTDPEDATIVRAVIALAHNLEFKVIAEGVETQAHCDFLSQNRCDEIQGYYFSKPLPAAEFEALLRSGRRLF